MSWYKKSVNNLLKEHKFELESSKMPCAKFSKQKNNENPCNCHKKEHALDHLQFKEEDLDDLV